MKWLFVDFWKSAYIFKKIFHDILNGTYPHHKIIEDIKHRKLQVNLVYLVAKFDLLNTLYFEIVNCCDPHQRLHKLQYLTTCICKSNYIQMLINPGKHNAQEKLQSIIKNH